MSFYIACHFTLRGNTTQLERDTAGVIKEERKRGETASICWPPLRAPKRPGIPKSYDVCDRSKGYNHSLWERSHHGTQTVSSHPTKGYLFSTLKKNTKRPLNQNWIRLSSSDELKKKMQDFQDILLAPLFQLRCDLGETSFEVVCVCKTRIIILSVPDGWNCRN